MGQVAAKVAKSALRDALSHPEAIARIRVDPRGVLDAAFRAAHVAIEDTFRAHYEEAGWVVERHRDGYLTRTRQGGGVEVPPMCIHGGTTATVLLLLDGHRAVVANVGDSTAIVSGLGRAGVLRPVEEWSPLQRATSPVVKVDDGGLLSPSSFFLPSQRAGAASATEVGQSGVCGCSGGSCVVARRFGCTVPLPCLAPALPPVPPTVASSYMELSADHSPECAAEFARIASFRPHGSVPHHPELLFVYDTLTASKLACPSIFEVNNSGSAARTERGAYYKNVRCEWATLVATPPHAPFQDALAFTRSLGDLHLQTYGVSHIPEVWWLDLAVLEDGVAKAPLVPHAIAIVVASDGVWDNWKFEEVASVVLARGTLAQVIHTDSAQGAADALMAANLERARVNFGQSADNMTAICMYLIPATEPGLPVAAVAVT